MPSNSTNNIKLNILQKTITNLKKSLSMYHDANQNSDNMDLVDRLKESVVQCFEVSYEISMKTMIHYLKHTSPDYFPAISVKNLYRLAHKHHIIISPSHLVQV